MNAQPPRIAIPEPTSTDTAYNQRSLPPYLAALHSAQASRMLASRERQRPESARMLASRERQRPESARMLASRER